MAHVLVTRALPGTAVDRLRAEHEVDVWDGDVPLDPSALRARAAAADAVLATLEDRLDGAFFAAAPKLRAVANYAVGTDNVDLEAARARTIRVGATPDVLTQTTAELAVALALALLRRVVEADASVRAGEWRAWQPQGFLGRDLRGSTAVVVGAGRIGRVTGDLLEGFGARVVGIGRDDPLAEWLPEADLVTLHAPLTPQTRGLIGAGALAAMKPTAVLVNTARGPLVDTDALVAALESGAIAGAALDVTDPEPLPAGHPLLAAPNLVVVPHIGSATHATREAMADMAVDNLLAALAGGEMPHPA